MKKKFLFATSLLSLLITGTSAQAGYFTVNPFQGVQYSQLRGSDAHSILGWNTSPLNVDVMEIDLGANGISFTSTPANGAASGETTRQTTMQFMQQTNTEIAINTTFFGTVGSGANNVGLVVADGSIVSSHANGWPTINLSIDNQIELLTSYGSNQHAYYNATSGSDIIVQNGQLTGNGQLDHATSRHPRTAIGYNEVENKLILMTVDGRQTDTIGVKNDELGKLMQAFGATWAVNYDGGGSTQMTMNNGTAHYVNSPSEQYRAVGSNLGVHAIVDNSYVAFANFEHGNRATFEYSPGYSGSSNGFNESASTAELVNTDTPMGQSALKVTITDDTNQTSEWMSRIVSGANATRSQNLVRTADGFVGVWAKTTDEGAEISIAIDDPTGGTERGIRMDLIADGEWHLYEWNLDDAAAWDAWAGSSNGQIDGTDFTIDSVQIWGTGNKVIYLDNISHNALGSLSIPEPASIALLGLGTFFMMRRKH
ncbi:phosphodiester glycosidase family protein [Poriferisphaera sp. WC338]|uniref:phosphodiester glycosidase family protein n=1 Tax=Poriferisphaera sp. WC338 TaxID=3425129 RepID=UPI003D8178B0